MNGIGSHTRPNHGNSVEWFTPPEIISALGRFDMDPCIPGLSNGLEIEWHGRVFLNPPYTRNIGLWLKKLANHGNGIAIIFARTETRHFFSEVWNRADAIFFFRGRLHFFKDGRRSKLNAGGPSWLIAYGTDNVQSILESGLNGSMVQKWRIQP